MVMSNVTMKTAGEFKTHCLALMDDVQSSGGDILITKRGRPAARLVPAKAATSSSLFGRMAGSVKIHGNLLEPLGESWNAEEEA